MSPCKQEVSKVNIFHKSWSWILISLRRYGRGVEQYCAMPGSISRHWCFCPISLSTCQWTLSNLSAGPIVHFCFHFCLVPEVCCSRYAPDVSVWCLLSDGLVPSSGGDCQLFALIPNLSLVLQRIRHQPSPGTSHQGVRERAWVPQLVMLCRRWAHLQCSLLGALVTLIEQLQAIVLPENAHNTATSGLFKTI